jgi:hypothetical protein
MNLICKCTTAYMTTGIPTRKPKNRNSKEPMIKPGKKREKWIGKKMPLKRNHSTTRFNSGLDGSPQCTTAELLSSRPSALLSTTTTW